MYHVSLCAQYQVASCSGKYLTTSPPLPQLADVVIHGEGGLKVFRGQKTVFAPSLASSEGPHQTSTKDGFCVTHQSTSHAPMTHLRSYIERGVSITYPCIHLFHGYCTFSPTSAPPLVDLRNFTLDGSQPIGGERLQVSLNNRCMTTTHTIDDIWRPSMVSFER